MIAENEGISRKTLSEAMYCTKGAISIMLNKLVKKGLGRKYALFLTDQGRLVNENHLKYDEKQMDVWFLNST